MGRDHRDMALYLVVTVSSDYDDGNRENCSGRVNKVCVYHENARGRIGEVSKQDNLRVAGARFISYTARRALSVRQSSSDSDINSSIYGRQVI